MTLPRLYLIADVEVASESGLDLLQVIGEAVAALPRGRALVQLRGKGRYKESLGELAQPLRDLCRSKELPFLINGDQPLAYRFEGVGIHLPEHTAVPFRSPSLGPVGTSVHDLAGLERARVLAVDYALLSPAWPTESKPGAPHLGREGLASMLGQCPGHPPVYALGGLDVHNGAQALEAGCHGIAAIRSWMLSDAPGQAALDLLAATEPTN